MRSSPAVLGLLSSLVLLGLACGGEPLEPPASGPITNPVPGDALPTPPPAAPPPAAEGEDLWPEDPQAVWPQGCLIEGSALHPSQPWLAAACTNADAETGAVLVFDLAQGRLRAVTELPGYVGWSDANLVRWHVDGALLAVNVDTNGVLVLERGEPLQRLFPDDTRDSGVGFVWVGDRLYMDTGHLVQPEKGEPRFDFEYREELPWFRTMFWNTELQAVVGSSDKDALAFDPVAERELVRVPLLLADCALDGRWCARRVMGTRPSPDTLEMLRLKDAKTFEHSLSGPVMGRSYWSSDGHLAVSSYQHNIGAPATAHGLDVFVNGEQLSHIALKEEPLRAWAYGDVGPVSWAPGQDALAVLFADQSVVRYDAKTGSELGAFRAPAPPIPAGLPHWYTPTQSGSQKLGSVLWGHPERIVRVDGHFLSVWTVQGKKLAEFVVPTERKNSGG